MRVGVGFDAHAFDPSRPLVIGGVLIPDHSGLAGHSDADVLSHSIADALLGAAGLGDLGGMFPDTEQWREASSLLILEQVHDALAGSGWGIGNIDATVIAQSPRLETHVQDMRNNVAGALAVSREQVSIKASTTDRLGFTGRGEGIAAIAVALVQPLG